MAAFALDGGDAEQAALLLGVATAQRGTLDHGNPEVMAVLDEVRTALGPAPAEEAVERGRTLPKPDGMAAMDAYLQP